jgi:deoxyribodipyrimidine photolyase-related protein
MQSVAIIFPNQLFENNPILGKNRDVILIEENSFFKQYSFHKQKLRFHRASMKFYESFLKKNGYSVDYIESKQKEADLDNFFTYLKKKEISEIHYNSLNDIHLWDKIKSLAANEQIRIVEYDSPLFLNTRYEIEKYFRNKKRFYQTGFYKEQRKKRNILLNDKKNPIGGKWTYDNENRLKYPQGKKPPKIEFPSENQFMKEAQKYIESEFNSNVGNFSSSFVYPCTFKETRAWLNQFLENRLQEFGPYEDAIVSREHVLHHSLLSPMLNAGLLTPGEVIDAALDYSSGHEVPLNSLEGFIRQILGWREFIRAVYVLKGRKQRVHNFWGFKRKIPSSFYSGTTGIKPVDIVIDKILQTGYCHHIERLMILGNFMLLCEFDPDEVYRWFMEMFIDAYDWVMVPNVYGMSQYADGGIMTTKPYISSSNYIIKMSDVSKGSWQDIWDALFWRFMHVHRGFFLQNPRLGMLVRTFDKMPMNKQKNFIQSGESFLIKCENLH